MGANGIPTLGGFGGGGGQGGGGGATTTGGGGSGGDVGAVVEGEEDEYSDTEESEKHIYAIQGEMSMPRNGKFLEIHFWIKFQENIKNVWKIMNKGTSKCQIDVFLGGTTL